MRHIRSTLLYSALLLCAATPQAAPQSETAIQAFQADYFEAFSPVTALDMVERLPGFTLSEGDTSRRGLGDSFGNLLIDGERPANKSIALGTLLERIPAGHVARIDLVPAGNPVVEAQGHALLVNVILRSDSQSSASYRLIWRQFEGGRSMPAGSFSLTRRFNGGHVTGGVDFSLWAPRLKRHRQIANGTGVLSSASTESDQVFDREVTPSVSLELGLSERGSLRLDADARFWTWNRNFFQSSATASGVPSYATSQTEDHGASYRVSASYEHDWADQLTSRTVLLATQDDTNNGPERFARFSASGFERADIVRFTDRQREFAVRHNFSWRISDQHAWELGAEAALNTGDTQLDIQLDDGVSLTSLSLPVAATRIEEDRGEVFVRHIWAPHQQLSLTTGLRWEGSDLSLSGDVVQARSFSFAKPSVILDYRPGQQTRMRLSAARDVDQLNFSKFTSSVDVSDNNSTIGNPDYLPQSSWAIGVEYERRWGEDAALLLKLDHTWVQDLDDWIAVVTPTSAFDAPGNIGDGRRWRATVELSTSLERAGLAASQIDVSYTYQDTIVSDPLTGREREWSGARDHRLVVDYRQAFPERDLAWGLNYSWNSDWSVYRARERRDGSTNGGDIDLYIESTRWNHGALRLGVLDVLDNGAARSRHFFTGTRDGGRVSSVEHRQTTRGPIVYLQLSGSF